MAWPPDRARIRVYNDYELNQNINTDYDPYLADFDLAGHALDALDGGHVLLPQVRAAQRLAPALLVLLADNVLQLQGQAAQHIRMLLAVIYWVKG